jgi:hypothetical protein
MARERTADDNVLALLARSSVPLARAQICAELGWTKQMASKVLLRLVQDERVDVTPGVSDGSAVRPAAKYSIKLRQERAGTPPKPRFERDTICITPSNREARVLHHRRDGFVEIEYLDGPRTDARTAIHEDLLRAIQPGRARPAPVLVTT